MDVPPADLRAVFDNLQDSVVLLDEDQRITHVNRRLQHVTGLDDADLQGTPLTVLADFTPDPAFTAFQDGIDAVLASNETERRVEIPVTSPVLGERIVDARISSYTDSGGDTAAIVVLRDVTDRKERERAIENQSEQLAIINRVLRHDIRNDMTVVRGWAEQLHHTNDDPTVQDITARLVEHSDHIIELTEEARDLVDAIEADWELDLEPLRVDRVLDREVTAIREQYPDATITLDDPHEATVQANEFLASVFRNLLLNAITHNDTPTPQVTITTDRTPETIAVHVADDGPGIPPDLEPVLFEKGQKALDSSGTGIGLYLVDSLVTAYHGDVTVTDNDPRGAVFTVELPTIDDA